MKKLLDKVLNANPAYYFLGGIALIMIVNGIFGSINILWPVLGLTLMGYGLYKATF